MGDRDYPVTDLGEAIELIAASAVAGVNVALPGRVEHYDGTAQRARIKPLVQGRTREGAAVDLPVLSNVPVLWPTFGGFVLIGTLAVGDIVQLQIHDRSIDDWKASEGERAVTPASARRHNLADAVAYPGLRPFGKPRTLPATAGTGLYLGGSGYATGDTVVELTRLEISSDGKLLLGNGTVDVINTIVDALDTLRTATYGGGAIDPVAGAALLALSTALGALKP